MVGRIGSVQRSQDGQTYGFTVLDENDRPCVDFGFSTWHEAGSAARQMQGLLVRGVRCVRREGLRFNDPPQIPPLQPRH
jgi:hypothetical protein